MTDGRTRLVVAAATALIALVYLLPFRGYGLNVDDEGALLYQIQRVVGGEVPYVDFMTGYTPGYFYVSAALWRLAGDLPTFRILLALVQAGIAGGLALATMRVASPPLALAVALLYLAFIPVFPGEFCTFNIPYPAWLATLTWVALALALTTFVVDRRRGWLVAAGLVAAAAFGIKPNAGVFAIAAAASVVLLVESPGAPARPASAPVWYGLWGGIVAGAWVTFGLRPWLGDALAYLTLLTIAFVLLPTRARTRRAGLVGDVAALLGSFGAVTLPWMALLLGRLGTEGMLRDVLLVGSGAAELYYKPYPPLEPWAVLVTALVLGTALAGDALRRGWVRPRQVAAVAVVGLVLSMLAIARVALMPERTTWSVIWQLESAGFPLTLLAQAAGVAWLMRRRASAGCEVPAALLLCALFMHLQLYPRPDFIHLVMSAPLTAVFAAFLLERVLGWWDEGLARAGLPRLAKGVRPAAIAVLLLLSLLRVSPSLAALQAPRITLPFATAPVGVEAARAADLRDLGAAATRLAAEVPRGGPSLAFPAADVALFLAGGRNPTPYAYFFPGRPDHREEADIVDTLAAAPPRALVSLNRKLTFFDAAPPYYLLLRRFVRARYDLLERHGRFDVLGIAGGARAAAAEGARRVPETLAARDGVPSLALLRMRPLAEAAPALLGVATGDDVVLRRAALGVLGELLEASPARGLEEYVANAGLDRRREVLLLRTIRDEREARAASYLFAAAARPDGRVASEALGAMYVTRSELIARRNLWAGEEAPTVWPGRAALEAALGRVLADPAAPPRATAFAAHLAGALGTAEVAPLLRGRLAGDAATAASAANALAALAPAGTACELVALLARPEIDVAALVPTVIVGLVAQPDPVGGEARGCLAGAITSAGPGREPAIWTAAASGDAGLAPALRTALAAEAPGVRRAAAWALGEMPADAASALALAPLAAGDPDRIVRRLATQAAAKQAGQLPRSLAAAAARSAG